MHYSDRAAPVLRSLHLTDPVLLGEGGEGLVYAYGEREIVSVYKKTTLDYLESVEQLRRALSSHQFPYELPRILDIGCVSGVYYTIGKRLGGDHSASFSRR